MDGSLIEILHGEKLRETSAMARGIRLEPQVLEVVSNKLTISFERCGLMIHPNHPIFGASPDGINKDFTVEIKCPSNDKSYFDFIDASGKSSYIYYLQSIQSYITFTYLIQGK
jgi:hypothetical protein